MHKTKVGEEAWESMDYDERRSQIKQRKIERRRKRLCRRKLKREYTYDQHE